MRGIGALSDIIKGHIPEMSQSNINVGKGWTSFLLCMCYSTDLGSAKLNPLLEGMSAVIFLLSRYDYLQTMLTPLIRSECTVLKQFNQARQPSIPMYPQFSK